MTIQIRNLTKIYGEGPNAVAALLGLNLEVHVAEILIIRGPNGSGKTTFLSILSGELMQTSGEIQLAQVNEEKPRIAVVQQFENLVTELTVKEHFELLGNVERIDLLPIDLHDKKPNELSRGDAQKVAVALSMSTNPDLLLTDEPTGALGLAEAQELYSYIREIAKANNIAVVLVTHDAHAEEVADRVVRLRDGRISETWEPGKAELQVIDSNGWLRIPEELNTTLARNVSSLATDSGLELIGKVNSTVQPRRTVTSREVLNNPILEIKNLTTKYGQAIVSQNLEFAVNQNDLFVVSGKSGSGKTTLLKTIAGLHADFSGDLKTNPDYKIKYFNIENLYGLALNQSELQIPEDLINQLDLSFIAKRALQTYSGGQKQRALLAMALVSDADILLLDEPTSALDDYFAEIALAAITKYPKTIIAATHDERLITAATNSLELS